MGSREVYSGRGTVPSGSWLSPTPNCLLGQSHPSSSSVQGEFHKDGATAEKTSSPVAASSALATNGSTCRKAPSDDLRMDCLIQEEVVLSHYIL